MRAFAILLLSLIPLTVTANDTSPFKVLGRWGYGETRAVFNAPGEIFNAKGSFLEILNYDPEIGFQKQTEILLSGGITSISVVDTLAFVGCGTAGVEIVDIRSRKNARRINTLSIPGEVVSLIATDVFVHSPVLFILTDKNGLFIYDFSDVNSPQQLAFLDISDYGKDLFFDSNLLRLYCAEYNAGLEVIDVSDPAHPSRMGRYNTGGLAYGVYVQDNRAYLADYHKGLRVIDVANPAAMSQIVNFSTNGNAYDVVVWDTVAVVALGEAGLELIDLTEKKYPISISLRGNATATTLSQCNHQIFVPSGNAGLQIVEIGWDNSYVKYQLLSFGTSRSIAYHNNVLYIASGYGGLTLLDMGNPTSPIFLSQYPISQGYGRDVAVKDTVVFLAANEGGVYVFGLSQPQNPHLLTQIIPASGSSYGVFLVDDTLFVANGSYGVTAYQVQDPRNPQEIARFTTAYKAMDVVVENHIAYVSDYLQGLQSFDVSDFNNIKQLGTTDVPVNGLHVTLHDSLAYLAAKQSGVRIIDINHPDQLHEIGYFRATDYASTRAVAVRDSMLFLADGKEGIHAALFSSSGEITLQGGFLTGDLAYDIILIDTLIVVAGNNSGIFVFDYQPSPTVGIHDNPNLAREFSLLPNYPNPFNPTTHIRFTLQKKQVVTLEIFNIQGKKVSTLLNQQSLHAGLHDVVFSASGLPSGIYFYRLNVEGKQRTGKMILVR